VGAAVCWEFMRTQTARRLRGRVDLVVGGSCWWSIPEWSPAPVFRRMEAANARTAAGAAPAFAPLVGAPVVHAAHAGPISCPMPWSGGLRYRGTYEGGAVIADAAGRTLARRDGAEGEGVAVADVEPRRVPPAGEVPRPARARAARVPAHRPRAPAARGARAGRGRFGRPGGYRPTGWRTLKPERLPIAGRQRTPRRPLGSPTGLVSSRRPAISM
jgi:hypothetical protein